MKLVKKERGEKRVRDEAVMTKKLDMIIKG